MANYLITGTPRGLGLEMARQLASMPDHEVGTIVATARGESSEGLKKLMQESSGRVVFVKLDATSVAGAKEAVKETEHLLGSQGLDVLINNAGILNATPNGITTM